MSSLVRLALVSHAQSAAMSTARFPTAEDPLSEQGLRRAGAAAALFDPRSDLRHDGSLRTRQTCEAWGADGTIEERIGDLDVGSWRGRRLEQIDPGALQVWHGDPAAAPHGGESLLELFARVQQWLESLVARHQRITAVTHPSVIRAAVVTVLGGPPAMFWRVDVQPLSRTLLTARDGTWTLLLPAGEPAGGATGEGDRAAASTPGP